MAQDSAFWDGSSTGHAASTDVWSAPYSSLEYSDIYSKLLGSNVAKGFVIPGYNNNLAITANSPAAMNVLAATGGLFIRGKIYENTAQQTLTIGAADATNPRIDRIVARITFASQTVELAVLAGTPAATPALPSLTQNATTYEISLAYVWVAALAASIAATEVHDERLFATNLEALLSTALQTNLLTNSEFMAFSRLATGGSFAGASAGAPDGGWTIVGTVTTWASLTKPAQMSRGRAVKITAGAGTSGMQQIVRVRASTVYAIKGLIQVTAGDVGSVVVTTNSASPGTVTKLIRRTGAWVEYYIYYTTEADASTLTLQLLCNSNTDIVDFGQWLIIEGFNTGPFRQIHETVIFDQLLNDSDFDLDTFATDGTTVIDLDSDYQGIVLPSTRAVLLFIHLQNNGTSTSTFKVLRTGTAFFYIYIAVDPNGIIIEYEGWVPVDPNMQFDYNRDVGTAPSFDITALIKGILT